MRGIDADFHPDFSGLLFEIRAMWRESA